MKLTTFINLSGGVDSTYYLWRWLSEHPNEKILVHHCLYLKNRLKEEKKACDDIIKYLTDHGLDNFKYVETGIQKGTLRGRILDIELLAGQTAIVVKMHPSVKDILLSYCAEESPPLHKHLKTHEVDTFDPSHRYTRINRVMEILTERNFNYICYRGKDGGLMSKKEMIHSMPKKLFELTWYCRRPIKGNPCKMCHTCRKVKRAFQ